MQTKRASAKQVEDVRDKVYQGQKESTLLNTQKDTQFSRRMRKAVARRKSLPTLTKKQWSDKVIRSHEGLKPVLGKSLSTYRNLLVPSTMTSDQQAISSVNSIAFYLKQEYSRVLRSRSREIISTGMIGRVKWTKYITRDKFRNEYNFGSRHLNQHIQIVNDYIKLGPLLFETKVTLSSRPSDFLLLGVTPADHRNSCYSPASMNYDAPLFLGGSQSTAILTVRLRDSPAVVGRAIAGVFLDDHNKVKSIVVTNIYPNGHTSARSLVHASIKKFMAARFSLTRSAKISSPFTRGKPRCVYSNGDSMVYLPKGKSVHTGQIKLSLKELTKK